MKFIISVLVCILVLYAAPQSMRADTHAPADLPPDVMAGIRLVATAPYALAIASAIHRTESGKWPTKVEDISPSLEANRSMLPDGFTYRKVGFRKKGEDCVISFAFDWPTLEGGSAEGTIRVKAGSSLKEMLEGAEVKWKKEPKMIIKKKAEPGATDNPDNAQ